MIKPTYICFDIETAPYGRTEIIADAEPFDPTGVKLGNRKNQALIDEHIADARVAYYDRFIEDAALHATTGKVLVIGMLDTHDNKHTILEGEEPNILLSFWGLMLGYYKEASSAPIVGFNILGFDLPFVCRRSWKYGLHVPHWIFDGRYFSRRFVDLMTVWECGNRQDKISLDKLARFVGLEGKQRSGKGFHELYASDHTQAIEYVKNDLSLCAKIAARMQI